MISNKIIFHSSQEYNSLSDKYLPVPASKVIPDWYSSYEKFLKDKHGKIISSPNGERFLTFKSCPALLDMFLAGYFLVTPCDLFFYIKNGEPYVTIDSEFKNFCGERQKMEGFDNPYDYYEKHFYWYPNWAPELPSGYSSLYLNPINHYNLPFHTIEGIIDNDKLSSPGNMPFFIKKGFEGIIPAGTPYMLIIPFKREGWQMEIMHHTKEEIKQRTTSVADIFQKYRVTGGGGYKKHMWSRKRFD